MLCKLATFVLDHKVTMSGEKQVLVQLGSYNWVVTLDCGSLSGATEREAILDSILNAFSIEQNDTVTLQVKDESWGGVFVDSLIRGLCARNAL